MTRLLFDPATDYYRLLGVKPNATPQEIHAAYRRLARAYHPDIHPGSTGSLVRMARVNVAKSVLLDPNMRAAYDLSRNRPHGPAVPAVQGRTATQKGGRRFDYSTALMLAIVAPLMVALLLYAVSGVQVAACPVPFLAC
jgi:DnaJ-class molecular chaperone